MKVIWLIIMLLICLRKPVQENWIEQMVNNIWHFLSMKVEALADPRKEEMDSREEYYTDNGEYEIILREGEQSSGF